MLRAVLAELHTFPIAMPSGDLGDAKFVGTWPWKTGDVIYEFETKNMNFGDVPQLLPIFNVALAEDVRPLQVESITNVLDAILSQVKRALVLLDGLRAKN